MAKIGSGKRQMQAELKRRQKGTNKFCKKINKFLGAIATFIFLMFKYLFLAIWWLIKYLFKMCFAMLKYTYLGLAFPVKKIAEKIRSKKNVE